MADFRLGRLKFNWRGNWTASTAYVIDDIVKFGANSYVCIKNHTSTSNEQQWYSADLPLNWSLHTEGVRNRGAFVPDTFYKVNDIFKSANTQYIVGYAFTASSFDPVGYGTYVSVFATGLLGEGAYNSGQSYQPGDVVSYNGNSYVAITTAIADDIPAENLGTIWDIIAQGVNPVGIVTWSPTTQYAQGDLIQIGGDTFRYKIGVGYTNINPIVDTAAGGGGAGLGTAWSLFNTGLKFVGTYSSQTTYYRGHVVEYSSSAYVGVGTVAILNVTPGSDPNRWSALALGDSNALLTTKGDMLIRDASAPARLGIGFTYQSLGVGTDLVPQWMTIGDATRIYYVDPELGSDTFNGSTPDMAFRSLKYACENASAVTNITGFDYTKETGVSTITAPSHGILYPNILVQLKDIEFECLSGGRAFDIQTFVYSHTAGVATVNLVYPDADAGNPNLFAGQIVRLRNLQFTCPGGSGITTTIFPDGSSNYGFNFPILSVNGPDEFVIDVGVSTIPHTWVSGGTAFVGFDTTIFPDDVTKSYFRVDTILDNDTFVVTAGISTIDHEYVSGGKVVNLSPAVIKLSASEFAEQLPITVHPFTSIVGSTLRSSKVRPADGLSPDGITPNKRQKMFKLSDATTIQGINVSGLVGFAYNESSPFELDKTTVRTGVGTTACGIFFNFNEKSPILNKSPYVKDCTSFSDPANDGTGHGGGVGVFLDGSLHNEGFKTMVFDAYTNVNSDGAGFILDRDTGAEIVSCFTYYCRWGYYSGGGSRIRSVGGNNSYGDYGVIASGFSTSEVAITGRVFGDRIDIQYPASLGGTIAVGDTFIGQTTKARGWIINDQRTSDRFYIKYEDGYGNPATGIGTTALAPGEIVDTIGVGYTGVFAVQANADAAYKGQRGAILEVDDLSAEPTVGAAIGFTTTGIGTDANYYIINNVTGFTTNYTLRSSVSGVTTYFNRATLRLSPAKGPGSPDTRGLFAGADNQTGGGSRIEIRSKFSNARLTGHDFLSVGVGNKVETNYPNVNEALVAQGNETSTFGPGKVFYVSTDQGGNFRVGDFFSVNQLTGAATLDATAFNLSGLSELRLGSLGGQVGEAINEFSSDETMAGDSNTAVPTEKALVGYLKRDNMGTDAMVPPKGTTAQRPTGANRKTGNLRYNTDLNAFETWNGTAWVPVGGLSQKEVSSNYNAGSFEHLWINTTSAAVTVTLPATPNKGDLIRFMDVANTFDTNNLTINRNGNPIGGLAENMTVNTEGAAFDLIFYDNTRGWRIFTV